MLLHRVLSEHSVRSVSFSVAGTAFVLRPSAPLKIGLDEASRLFSGAPSEHEIELDVRWGDLSKIRRETSVFDSGGSWALRRGEGGSGDWIFDFYTPVFGTTAFRSARLDAERRRGEVVLEPAFYGESEPADALAFPLAELLVTQLIARDGGIEFHGCGIRLEDGRGVLFVGHSGGGKTTTAKLWDGIPGVTILSDDRIIARRDEGDCLYRIYGTPWHGEGRFAANMDAPLAAIFVLEHGTRNETIRIGGADAVTALFARAFPPFYDPEAVESTLATLQGIVESVPCFRFPFVPGVAAVELVRRTVGGFAS